jgi:hypothetical protein
MWFHFLLEYVVLLIVGFIKVEFGYSIGSPLIGFIWVFLSFTQEIP